MERLILVAFVAVTLVLSAISCGGSSNSATQRQSEFTGICAEASHSNYVLPYPVGTEYVVYQGYPPFNHDSAFKFAIDFSMPSGSMIVAARSGVVEFVEERYEDNDFATGHENLVTIDHGDGSFARYVHLIKNGALVERGETIARGQSVGLSGATGSGVEHLHFDVTSNCSSRMCSTVPVCFANTKPHPDGLLRGERYRAEPY